MSTYSPAATGTSRTPIQCSFCSRPIKFDDRRVSARTGKMIPLDAGTEQPHNCPMRPNPYQSQQSQQPQPQQIRYHPCNKGCGKEIYFDVNNTTTTGKWIPLDKRNGLPHECSGSKEVKP